MNTRTSRAVGLASAVLAALALATPTAFAAPMKVGANHDRSIELVSARDKLVPASVARMSPDGDRVVYGVAGGTDEAAYGAGTALFAERGAAGWKTSSALPARGRLPGEDGRPVVASPDLREYVFAIGLENAAIKTYARYAPQTGDLAPGYVFGASVMWPNTTVASDDLLHVVAAPEVSLVAEDSSPVGGLYDFGSGEAVLIGLLPGETAPACGVRRDDFIAVSRASDSQHWISRDGRRVFFHTRGNDCTAPPNLYMREGGEGGFTRLISGPVIAGPDLGARFSRATADGSKVFYTTASRLDVRDTNEGFDVYRYTVNEGNWCVTCAVSDAQVITPAPGGVALGEAIVVAEDGSRVYFTSTSDLAAGATAGSANLYVWRASSPYDVTFVAPAEGTPVSSSSNNVNAVTTRDGSVLVFTASHPELNAVSGDNGGVAQYYRYDDHTGEIACMSCPPAGAATSGVGPLSVPNLFQLASPYVLSDDGRTFVFSASSDALVPQDVNAGPDVYEWRDGGVGLISDGRSAYAQNAVRGVTPDGKNVLFSSSNVLVPGVLEGTTHIYSARIGGGFPEPMAPGRCEGEGCRGAPTGPPAPRAPVSAGGGGDVSSPARVAFGVRSLTRAQRSALARGKVVRVLVRVGRPGLVTARLGAGGPVVSRRAISAGTVGLPVRLTARARRTLSRRGRLSVGLTVRFAGSQSRTVKLNLRRSR